MKQDETSSLKDVFKDINKKYGDTIGYAGDNEGIAIETWDTGCLSLNHVLGNGGLAKGRVYELFGSPSDGKSTASMFLVAQIQKQGGKCAYIDAEYTFNEDHAKKIGIDVDKLIFAQPETGEQAADIIEKLIHTGEMALIVVDSSAALVPSKELEGSIEDSNIALQARMMSKLLRMITGAVAKTKTIVIFISQTRDKIGMFTGPTKDTTSGNALKFYASVRLEVKKIKQLKDGDEIVGNRIKMTAVKNKVAPPFREAEVDLYFQSGFDMYGDLVDYAEKTGAVSKTGNTYSFNGEKIAVGRDATKEAIKNNQTLYEQIKESVTIGKPGTESGQS